MAQSADLKAKIEALNKVFQFYYKENFKTLRKATDFYIPWFMGRKKRLEEFQKQYIPFSVALFFRRRSQQHPEDGRRAERGTDRSSPHQTAA